MFIKHLKGTTLIETLVSTAVFALLVVAIFTIYDIGKLKWNVMYLRNQLQSDARKAMITLERDLRKTDYASVDVYTHPSVTPPGWTYPVPRWALCMVGLDNWSNTNNFDPVSGKPLWNQYIIYMADTETNQGQIGPLGPAGSGEFVRIQVNFGQMPATSSNPLATSPLPLHFPMFATTVDWLNNEFALRNEHLSKDETDPPFELRLAGFAESETMRNAVAIYCAPGDLGCSNPSGSEPPSPSFDNPNPSNLPTGQYNPQVETIYTDAANTNYPQLQTDLTNQINTPVNGTSPPVALNNILIKPLGTVFAFLVYKNDATRVIQISFKTKGYVSRAPQGQAGYESRQIDMNIAPQVYHER